MPEKDNVLTPERLLQAYANGYFPMALSHDDPELYWFSPEERGVIPLDRFHIPRGLRRALKTRRYEVTVNQAFEQVIRGCAEITGGDRDNTWINDSIIALYNELHHMGHAHSIEVWATKESMELSEGIHGTPASAAVGQPSVGDKESPTTTNRHLIGGLYGVSLGGAFFGESMFSRAPDASKIALVHLVEILRQAGYTLLDTQYVNDHLKQFGVEAVPKETYLTQLEQALEITPDPSHAFDILRSN